MSFLADLAKYGGGLMRRRLGDMQLALDDGTPAEKAAFTVAVSGHVVADGLTLTVLPFRVGSFASAGGSIHIAAAGAWYVGVEMWSNQVRLLPRLGHRGWVPVAYVVASATEVTSIEQIDPVMPPTRIPRTLAKVRAGLPVKVIVMGSSLTEGSGSGNWAGMVFSGGQFAHYKVPGSTLQNLGLGGTPNQYQLAQLGLASAYAAMNYNDSGYPLAITGGKTPPNGRTTVFNGCDVVVIGMLANGGDYRLPCLEPIIRNLRRAGVEVIVVTDNPQSPTSAFGSLVQAALYTDGPELMRVADLYGVEIADTAAYVAEAHLRAGGVGIYSDSIHMSSGQPVGAAAMLPANGHEAWARAVRSIFHIGVVIGLPTVTTRSWSWESGLDGVGPYSNAVVSVAGGQMVITRIATSQWGGRMPLVAPVKSGDTVAVSGTVWWDVALWGVARPSIGLQGGGGEWGGSQMTFTAPGAFSGVLEANRDAGDSWVLLFGNWDSAPAGIELRFDNLTITVNATSVNSVVDPVPDRGIESKALPAPRIVTDMRTPGDAFVILPSDEHYTRLLHMNRGGLEAHPLASGSFARRFSAQVGASSDLLVLTPGKSAALAANGVVGFSTILYSVAGNPEATYEVWVNGVKSKTVTLPAQTLSREIYHPIQTPTELNVTSATPVNRVIDIRCTAGTIRIAALVALTSDLEFLPIEVAQRVGAWSQQIPGGAPNMPGYATDAAGSYMVARAPDDARRLGWICTAKSNGKLYDTWSGREGALAQGGSGVNHVRVYGNHVGPGDLHYLRCAESLAGGGDAAKGYALHVGGIIVVRDR